MFELDISVFECATCTKDTHHHSLSLICSEKKKKQKIGKRNEIEKNMWHSRVHLVGVLFSCYFRWKCDIQCFIYSPDSMESFVPNLFHCVNAMHNVQFIYTHVLLEERMKNSKPSQTWVCIRCWLYVKCIEWRFNHFWRTLLHSLKSGRIPFLKQLVWNEISSSIDKVKSTHFGHLFVASFPWFNLRFGLSLPLFLCL